MIESKLRGLTIEVNEYVPGIAGVGVDAPGWNQSTCSNPISSLYGSTGWKGLIYGNQNTTVYSYPAPGSYAYTFRLTNPTANTREMGTIRNNIVWGTINSSGSNGNVINVMKLNSDGSSAGHEQVTLPFSFSGLFTTNHPDLLLFQYNSTFYLLTINFDENDHYAGYDTYTTHACSGGEPNSSYNGTGGCFDVITGRVYINRWNAGSGSFQEFQAKVGTTSITNITPGTAFQFDFTRYVDPIGNRTTIGGGLDPYTGRMIWNYHGDGQVWYKDRAITTYPVSLGAY